MKNNTPFKGKNILVTGGTGLIGIPLVNKLVRLGGAVTAVSLDGASPFDKSVAFVRADLCEPDVCERLMAGKDIVFHLAGIKGSIGVAKTRAATFLIKNLLMNTLVMEAARKANVEKFLFASSICIYPPASVFEEKNAFTALPDVSDRFGAMSKFIGEMQIETYGLQYSLKNFFIARPANTYGPFDNFNPASALVIPGLIYRIFSGENPLRIWGDGSAIRDFVFCDDVAEAMVRMVIQNKVGPFNIGSGRPVAIKDLVGIIVESAQKSMGKKVNVEWDASKPSGEKFRVTSIDRIKRETGWEPAIGLEEGIFQTIDWYEHNKLSLLQRYSILSEE